MIFESDQLTPPALDDDVADEPLGSGDAGRVEQADAGQRLGVVRPVLVTEQLVAAADGEQGGAVFDRRPQRLTLRALQVVGDGDLLLVLAAAPEKAIDVARNRIADADLAHVDRDAAPLGTPPQGDDVAAVAVDVHLRRRRASRSSVACSSVVLIAPRSDRPHPGRRAPGVTRAARCRSAGRTRPRLRGRLSTNASSPLTRSAGKGTIRSTGTPAYLSRFAMSAPRMPVVKSGAEPVAEHLEVDVPEPGDVASVRGEVVDGNQRGNGQTAGRDGEHAQGLVEPDRILDQGECQRAAAIGHALDSAKGRSILAQRVGDSLPRHAERVGPRPSRRRRCRRCRAPGSSAATRASRSSPQGATRSRRSASTPSSAIDRSREIEGRARGATARTAPGPEVGTVQPIVGEILSTVPARLGVRGMRNLIQQKARVAVVQPEGDAARADPFRDRGQRRIVDVDDDGRLRRQPAQRGRPLRRRSCRALHSGRVDPGTDCSARPPTVGPGARSLETPPRHSR